MVSLLRYIEACLLSAMGIFMVVFARSDRYWQVINPKYSWLTCAAGALITFVGVAVFFHTHRKPKVTEAAAVAIFLCMALTVSLGSNPFAGESIIDVGNRERSEYAGDRYTGGSLTLQYDDAAVSLSEVSVGGETYTRINLAELLAGEDGGWAKVGGRFAVQGMILRTPEMDAVGYIAIGRLYIFCCFADAVGVVALVKVEHPEAYRTGAWVRVLGILREGSPFSGLSMQVAGAFSTARSDRFILQGVEVKETQMEGVPFILDIKKQIPFEY